MRLPTIALFPPRWTLLSLILLAAAALLWLSAGPASAQDGHQPDQQVVADVQSYARETQHGHAHVLRWMRVLHTFDALSDMTSTEAQGFAETYWSVRWDPVAAELEKLEQGQTPDSQVVSDVRSYSGETSNGADHVLRWYRVLHTFDALTAMTAAEAQGHANTFSASRWDPVVDELTELEAAEAGASGASDGGASGSGGPSGEGGASGASDGGASGDSDDGPTGQQSGAPTVSSATADCWLVTVNFNGNLAPIGAPITDAFTLNVNGDTREIISVRREDTAVLLWTSTTAWGATERVIYQGDTVTVSYNKGKATIGQIGKKLQSAADSSMGGRFEVANFTNQSVNSSGSSCVPG